MGKWLTLACLVCKNSWGKKQMYFLPTMAAAHPHFPPHQWNSDPTLYNHACLVWSSSCSCPFIYRPPFLFIWWVLFLLSSRPESHPNIGTVKAEGWFKSDVCTYFLWDPGPGYQAGVIMVHFTWKGCHVQLSEIASTQQLTQEISHSWVVAQHVHYALQNSFSPCSCKPPQDCTAQV